MAIRLYIVKFLLGLLGVFGTFLLYVLPLGKYSLRAPVL